jgi:hypothetical protein
LSGSVAVAGSSTRRLKTLRLGLLKRALRTAAWARRPSGKELCFEEAETYKGRRSYLVDAIDYEETSAREAQPAAVAADDENP